MRTISRAKWPKAAFHIHPWSVASGDQYVLPFHRVILPGTIVDERVASLRGGGHVDRIGRFDGHMFNCDVTRRMKKTNKTCTATATSPLVCRVLRAFMAHLPFPPRLPLVALPSL